MNRTRTATLLGAASIIGIAMTASPQAAVGQSPPALDKPTISGEPVVGETLVAAAQATGDPTPTLAYQWLECAPRKSNCDPIPAATESSYVVSAAYVDRRLAVRVRATNTAGTATERSALTAVVTAAPAPQPTPTPVPTPTPTPEPEPSPEPSPTPDDRPTPDDQDTPVRFHQSSASPVNPGVDPPAEPAASVEQGAERIRFLRPFPSVRITGTLVAGGARVSRLRIRAPATARVVVRCRGSGCRYFSRSTGGGRVRALERLLRSGTRITIKINRPGTIGKHVAIVIREGLPPRRRDACLMPGSARPVRCPAP